MLMLLMVAGCATAPEPGGELEVVAELAQGPGNIAVTPDGRLIISQHPLYRPDIRVIELLPDGRVVPFPNAEWAGARNEADIGLDAVLGIQADTQGIVWMLDNGRRSSRLVAWDTRTDALHQIIEVGEPARVRRSFFNDIAVDPVHRQVIITDASAKHAALVVVNMDTGAARRLLEGHPSVQAEAIAMPIGDRIYGVDKEGKPVASTAVDGITIDPDSEWVYYGASQSMDLWRVRAADLADASLSADALAERIERYGDRPVCDGITMDGAGNVYITDLTGFAVGVTAPSGEYRVLYSDQKLLSWTDGLAFGPDNYVYGVSNQLHRSLVFNRGKDLTEPPFYVVRFKALAPGTVGR